MSPTNTASFASTPKRRSASWKIAGCGFCQPTSDDTTSASMNCISPNFVRLFASDLLVWYVLETAPTRSPRSLRARSTAGVSGSTV